MLTVSSGCVANVARFVVERLCIAGGGEDGHASLALKEVTPLIRGRVPLRHNQVMNHAKMFEYDLRGAPCVVVSSALCSVI